MTCNFWDGLLGAISTTILVAFSVALPPTPDLPSTARNLRPFRSRAAFPNR